MLTVGQKLWYVPDYGMKKHAGFEVEVSKVGRKWATLNRGAVRIDKETLVADGKGYDSTGRGWLSEQDFALSQQTDKAWRSLVSAIQYKRRPPGVNLDEIKKAANLLRVSLEA
jgi:hypothetical protein